MRRVAAPGRAVHRPRDSAGRRRADCRARSAGSAKRTGVPKTPLPLEPMPVARSLPRCDRSSDRQGRSTSRPSSAAPTCCAEVRPRSSMVMPPSQLSFGRFEGAKGLLGVGRRGQFLAAKSGRQRIGREDARAARAGSSRDSRFFTPRPGLEPRVRRRGGLPRTPAASRHRGRPRPPAPATAALRRPTAPVSNRWTMAASRAPGDSCAQGVGDHPRELALGQDAEPRRPAGIARSGRPRTGWP